MVSVVIMLNEGETRENKTEINAVTEVIEEKMTICESKAVNFILSRIGANKRDVKVINGLQNY